MISPFALSEPKLTFSCSWELRGDLIHLIYFLRSCNLKCHIMAWARYTCSAVSRAKSCTRMLRGEIFADISNITAEVSLARLTGLAKDDPPPPGAGGFWGRLDSILGLVTRTLGGCQWSAESQVGNTSSPSSLRSSIASLFSDLSSLHSLTHTAMSDEEYAEEESMSKWVAYETINALIYLKCSS